MSNWFVVALIVSGIISLLVRSILKDVHSLWKHLKSNKIYFEKQILSTRLFGKEINRKSKSVTIIHSATTETVRLPDDSNGVSGFENYLLIFSCL